MRAGPHQSGITDPQWPLDPPDGAPPAEYERDRAGRVDRQEDLALVFADVDARPREALREVLVAVSRFARKEMDRPPARDLQAGAAPPSTYRVTVTVAFGASLFTTAQQDDRWGLAHLRPRQLRRMPRFAGDGAGFAAAANDLLFVIASDHPYVNAAIARSIAHGYVDPRLRVTRMEQGFARPDRREFLRFDDGIDNLRNRHERKELDELVYVQAGDDEPAWCRGGSYLVYRKIREHLRTWEALSVAAQEGAIGRNKRTGEPLSRHRDS
ncbi:MAG: Dyp-type peroxidase, partial [Planctomycetota bacterium]|nr:Dyp-type peroxidase [Planctomycetota bacterium]